MIHAFQLQQVCILTGHHFNSDMWSLLTLGSARCRSALRRRATKSASSDFRPAMSKQPKELELLAL